MEPVRIRPNIRAMGKTYAVSWKDAQGSGGSGRLVLGSHALRLEGNGGLELAYADLTDVSIGRSTGDRIGGRMTVLITRVDGRPLWIAPIAHQSMLREVHDRISVLSDGTSTE